MEDFIRNSWSKTKKGPPNLKEIIENFWRRGQNFLFLCRHCSCKLSLKYALVTPMNVDRIHVRSCSQFSRTQACKYSWPCTYAWNSISHAKCHQSIQGTYVHYYKHVHKYINDHDVLIGQLLPGSVQWANELSSAAQSLFVCCLHLVCLPTIYGGGRRVVGNIWCVDAGEPSSRPLKLGIQ